jgi:hypothetical protein
MPYRSSAAFVSLLDNRKSKVGENSDASAAGYMKLGAISQIIEAHNASCAYVIKQRIRRQPSQARKQ